MSLPQDSGYRHLFSHAIMVEHLLRGFVPEPWVAQLDFASLEPCNGHYVTDSLAERRSDLVWRVRQADVGWLYIYVLLEFQSRDDPWMALRMLAYVSLLYQDLVKTGDVQRPGELPPVFPVVVYHGSTPWRAARDMAGLFAGDRQSRRTARALPAAPVPEGEGTASGRVNRRRRWRPFSLLPTGRTCATSCSMSIALRCRRMRTTWSPTSWRWSAARRRRPRVAVSCICTGT